MYFGGKSGILSFKQAIINTTPLRGSLEYVTQDLTEPNNPIYITTLSTILFISSNRLPVFSPSSPVRWMWEVYKEQDFKYLEEYKPKVLHHDDNFEILWNMKVKDYAPDLIEYINKHYSLLSEDYPNLYIRNEYLEEAKNKLAYMRSIHNGTFISNDKQWGNIVEVEDGNQLLQPSDKPIILKWRMRCLKKFILMAGFFSATLFLAGVWKLSMPHLKQENLPTEDF